MKKKLIKNITVINTTFTCQFIICLFYSALGQNFSYKIVDTGVLDFYNDSILISIPDSLSEFYGQDGHYTGFEPYYTDNGNGTITDNVTELVWQKTMGEKISFTGALTKADTMTLGGYTDWRIPTIKELYSLILFSGKIDGMIPDKLFIDTFYFNQALGDTTIGERLIDAQTWSSTRYVGITMNADTSIFGVNFTDGRIKAYPKYIPESNYTNVTQMYFRMVRGNTQYGVNKYINNGDGTITDWATGLMWQQSDDGTVRNWKEALAYAENLTLANYSDWRLPNAKELQSIVDYEKCPDITQSPAIDSLFNCTMITDPDGNSGQYPYYWTGTTHLESAENPYGSAVYIAFGEAQGKMNGKLMDVHGAGAQRSDPKTGNFLDYPQYFGPQGDVRYVYNYSRCVRNVSNISSLKAKKSSDLFQLYSNPYSAYYQISFYQKQISIRVESYDISGKKIKEYKASNTNTIEINLDSCPSGIFILKLFFEHYCFTTKVYKL